MKKQLSVIMVLLLFLPGCQKQTSNVSAQTIRDIQIQSIENGSYTNFLTLSGTVTPTQTVKVSFKIPGIVSNVVVAEGDEIKAGQLVASLDQNDYQIKLQAAKAQQSGAKNSEKAALAQIEGAKAQLNTADVQIETEIPSKISQAKSQLDLIQVNYERISKLVESGAAPKSSLDEISTQLEVAKNTYQQALDQKLVAETKRQAAQAALEASQAQYDAYTSQTDQAAAALSLADSNISDTRIESPIDGVVLTKLVESGEVTSAGYPIVAIGAIDQVWVEVGVTDESISLLKKGQKASISVYGSDKVLDGVIDEIGAMADATTRSFPVKIVVNNKERLLKPGMICKVEIGFHNGEKVLIPVSSVIHLSNGSAVFVYEKESQSVKRKMIETGEIVQDKIEVKQGLDHGEILVIEGQYVLHDNDKVNIVSEKQIQNASEEMGQ